MDLDYVLAPALILIFAILAVVLSIRRIRALNSMNYRKWRRVCERVVLSLVILVAAAAGGSSAFNALAIHAYKTSHPEQGTIYEVQNHKMLLNCTGSGSPTLVLDAGLGNDSQVWGLVQPELSKATRVCSYDRAGFGSSEARSGPRDANRITDELRQLLQQAGGQTPYVLMGHSMAGVYIRAYTTRYPQDVAGLIFVDGSTPGQEEISEFKALEPSPTVLFLYRIAFILGVPRLMGECSHTDTGPKREADKAIAESWCRTHVTAAVRETQAIKQSSDETVHSGPFGKLPILIFSQDPDEITPGVPEDAGKQISITWNGMQENLKTLSTCSRRIIARGSGHFVQLKRPELLDREVLLFVQQIRDNVALPADNGSTVTK